MTVKKYYQLAKHSLFPICRSLTGNGVRKTLKIIKREFPKLKICKIRSGTKVFDWNVPPEWNVKAAYILDKNNKKIVDFKNNNLHLVGYSTPINKFFSKKKLFNHIHSLPKQPKAIPYITSYYKKYWGFCVSHNKKLKFYKNYKYSDKFKVVIKSNLNSKGHLNYGELILKGKSKQEILISTYVCHPSMANNELSGPIVSMCLINHFNKKKNLEKTIRFIFIPETIGSITYLNKNLSYLKANVVGGFNLSCIGDERQHSCMFSKYANTPSDRAIVEAYNKLKIKFKRYSFLERGSDERQYNSPGIDLPIASIFRTKYDKYPEYHTSLDNFSLVTEKGIRGGFNVAKEAIGILIKKIIPKNKILCEPQMGKRGLYPTLSTKNKKKITGHYMDFLQYADGKNDLESISILLNIKLSSTYKIYNILKKNNLVF
jgi:aminopeptidase-like protein